MKKLLITALVAFGMVFAAGDVSAQHRKKRVPPPQPAESVPAVHLTDAEIISRAQDIPDTTAQIVPANPVVASDEAAKSDDNGRMIQDLRNRVKSLEAPKKASEDEKQKRLALELDILGKAETRADGLRKQLFDMIERENTIQTKLDQIENNIRPETIDREVAFAGSMRPEELRNMKKKNLEIERTNLTSLLAEVQKTKANIEQNVQKADLLVDKLRAKFEKEIDDLLTDPVNP